MIKSVEIVKKDIKNMYLSVTPDCSVILKAPIDTPDSFIESFLKKKESWIEKQVTHFKSIGVTNTEKRYVSGESFKYLGKNYRLKVHKSFEERVSLYRGYIHLYVADNEDIVRKKQLIENWYNVKSKEKLFEIFIENYSKVTNNIPNFAVRKMKKRWGSCNFEKNKIILNEKLIEKPKYCIEYVVFHELAHLKHPNHSREFYNYLTYLLPDWEFRRERLNEVN